MQPNNKPSEHRVDSFIEKELQALRQVTAPDYGEATAARALMAQPKPIKRSFLPLGISSAATLATAAAIAFVWLGARPASASDVHQIATAQRSQKTRHQIAWIDREGTGVRLASEEWTDGAKRSFREFDASGKLRNWTGTDGHLRFWYFGPSFPAGAQPTAVIDVATSDSNQVETVDSYIQDPHGSGFTRQVNYNLDGKICDLYTFYRGMFRVYVDQKTRLPIQRDVFNKGKLFERDYYDYPITVDEALFKAPDLEAVMFYNYPAQRQNLRAQLDKPGQLVKVGDQTIDFKGVVIGQNLKSGRVDPRDVVMLFANPGSGSLQAQITGLKDLVGRDKLTITSLAGKAIGASFEFPLKAVVGTPKVDLTLTDASGRTVGRTTFTPNRVIRCPDARTLVCWPQPNWDGAKATTSVDKG